MNPAVLMLNGEALPRCRFHVPSTRHQRGNKASPRQLISRAGRATGLDPLSWLQGRWRISFGTATLLCAVPHLHKNAKLP